MLDDASAEAFELIRRGRSAVQAVVAALVEKRVLDGNEVTAAVAQHPLFHDASVMSGIINCGDSHGSGYRCSLPASRNRRMRSSSLRECELELSSRKQIAPVFNVGANLWWIPGNYEADRFEHALDDVAPAIGDAV